MLSPFGVLQNFLLFHYLPYQHTPAGLPGHKLLPTGPVRLLNVGYRHEHQYRLVPPEPHHQASVRFTSLRVIKYQSLTLEFEPEKSVIYNPAVGMRACSQGGFQHEGHRPRITVDSEKNKTNGGLPRRGSRSASGDNLAGLSELSKARIPPGKSGASGLVYWGLTPPQQPGSYQGGEMMITSVLWWRKLEYPEETTDLRQVTDETFHTYGLCPVQGLSVCVKRARDLREQSMNKSGVCVKRARDTSPENNQ